MGLLLPAFACFLLVLARAPGASADEEGAHVATISRLGNDIVISSHGPAGRVLLDGEDVVASNQALRANLSALRAAEASRAAGDAAVAVQLATLQTGLAELRDQTAAAAAPTPPPPPPQGRCPYGRDDAIFGDASASVIRLHSRPALTAQLRNTTFGQLAVLSDPGRTSMYDLEAFTYL